MALAPVRAPNGNGHSLSRQDVRSYARIPQVLEVPNLIESQIESYKWFREEGLKDVLREISPISDYTEKKYELHFREHNFSAPKYSPQECKEREITYSQPLYVTTHLVVKETGEIKEMPIFMGDFPMMTDNGTFIINGAERVVVSQLVRSPGIYFTTERPANSLRPLCMAKLIPSRGAWLEFETSNKDILSVKVDRKRKVSASIFLRALGIAYDDQLMALFDGVDTDETHSYMQATLRSDPAESREAPFPEDALRNLWNEEWLYKDTDFDRDAAQRIAAAQVEFYKRLRPGEPPSLDNSRTLIKNLFFEKRRYDLGDVGRHKLNGNLGRPADFGGDKILTREDIIAVFRKMIRINNGDGQVDDIDHLGNRRVRGRRRAGAEPGARRPAPNGADGQGKDDPGGARRTPRPRRWSTSGPWWRRCASSSAALSSTQFMDQTNPLAELTHKRRLSALGPGGLSRERAASTCATFTSRTMAASVPSRRRKAPTSACSVRWHPIARVNEFGFIESPYRKVLRELPKDSDDLRGRVVTEAVVNPETGHTIVNEGVAIGANRVNAIRALPEGAMIPVRPFVAGPSLGAGSGDGEPDDSVIWLSADKEGAVQDSPGQRQTGRPQPVPGRAHRNPGWATSTPRVRRPKPT